MGLLYSRGCLRLWGWIVIGAAMTVLSISKADSEHHRNPMDSFFFFVVNQEKLLQIQVNMQLLIPKDMWVQQHEWETWKDDSSINDWIEPQQFLLSIDELIRPENDGDPTMQPLALEQSLSLNEFRCPLPKLDDSIASPHVVLNCTASLPMLIPIFSAENHSPLLQQSATSITLMVALWEEHPRRRHCWTRRLVHLHPYAAVTSVALRVEREIAVSSRAAAETPSRTTLPVRPSWSFQRIWVYTMFSMLSLFCVGFLGVKKPNVPAEHEWPPDDESVDGTDQIDDENDPPAEHAPPEEETVLHADDDDTSEDFHALAPRQAPEASSSEDEDDLSPPTVARCTTHPSPIILREYPAVPHFHPRAALDFAAITDATERLCLRNGSFDRSSSVKPSPVYGAGNAVTDASAFVLPKEPEVRLRHPTTEPESDTPGEPFVEWPERSTLPRREPGRFSDAQHLKDIVQWHDSDRETMVKTNGDRTPPDVPVPTVQQQNKVTLSTHMKKRKASPPSPVRELPEETPIPTILNFESRVQDLVVLEPSKRKRSVFEPDEKQSISSKSQRLPFQSPLRTEAKHRNVASTANDDDALAAPSHLDTQRTRTRATPTALAGRAKLLLSPDFSYVSTLPPDSACSDDDDSDFVPDRSDSPERTNAGTAPPPATDTRVVVRSPLVVSSSESSKPLNDGDIVAQIEVAECEIHADAASIASAPTKTSHRSSRSSVEDEMEPAPISVVGFPIPLDEISVLTTTTTKRAPHSLWNAVPDIPISLSLLAAAEAAKDTGVWTFAEDAAPVVVRMPSKPRVQKKQRRSFPKTSRPGKKKGQSK